MSQNLVLILGALLGVSEALSLIPFVKANGVIQLVVGLLKSLLGKGDGPKALS